MHDKDHSSNEEATFYVELIGSVFKTHCANYSELDITGKSFANVSKY